MNEKWKLTQTDHKIAVIREIKLENSFEAKQYNNGIIEIIWDVSIETIEEIHLIQVREVILTIGGGKKMPLYFSPHAFLQISEKAKKMASTEEGGKYTLANAVLIDDLAKKIVFNFFMLVYKPKVPTKGFSNREDAFLWLMSLEQDY